MLILPEVSGEVVAAGRTAKGISRYGPPGVGEVAGVGVTDGVGVGVSEGTDVGVGVGVGVTTGVEVGVGRGLGAVRTRRITTTSSLDCASNGAAWTADTKVDSATTPRAADERKTLLINNPTCRDTNDDPDAETRDA